jgi:hypothetical protein
MEHEPTLRVAAQDRIAECLDVAPEVSLDHRAVHDRAGLAPAPRSLHGEVLGDVSRPLHASRHPGRHDRAAVAEKQRRGVDPRRVRVGGKDLLAEEGLAASSRRRCRNHETQRLPAALHPAPEERQEGPRQADPKENLSRHSGALQSYGMVGLTVRTIRNRSRMTGRARTLPEGQPRPRKGGLSAAKGVVI